MQTKSKDYPEMLVKICNFFLPLRRRDNSSSVLDAPNGIWTRVTSSTGSYDRPLHYRGFPSLSFRDINIYHASGQVIAQCSLFPKVPSKAEVNKTELICHSVNSKPSRFRVLQNRCEVFRVKQTFNYVRS